MCLYGAILGLSRSYSTSFIRLNVHRVQNNEVHLVGVPDVAGVLGEVIR